MKKTKKIVAALVFSIILLGVVVEISEAARWRYHAWRYGRVTVWGTRNCRVVTWPLVYRHPMYRCETKSGYLPWWCNDWLVRHEWGPPCYNVTWRKYVARPCRWSCWRHRWIMGPLDDYFVDYMPYRYSRSEFTLPSLGDPYGASSGNRGIFIFVDLGQWLDADANTPYVPLPTGNDPNSRSYYFSSGHNSSLPGYTVLKVDPNATVEQIQNLVTFDPNADPNGSPFVFSGSAEFFNGTLSLLSEDSFTSQPYNGNLMAADVDYSGSVNYNDLRLMATQWLCDVNTAVPSLP
jgi:hypothetical protein